MFTWKNLQLAKLPVSMINYKSLMYVAVVAKGLTHRFVDPAFVGSSPIDRPYKCNSTKKESRQALLFG